MHDCGSLTCIRILVHSYIAPIDSWCGTFFLNKLEPAGCVHPKFAVYNINLHSIISIATGIPKFICFLISYAFIWLSSDQLAFFFSESIYECGGTFRWPWGPGIGRAAVGWYQTEKFVLACYMFGVSQVFGVDLLGYRVTVGRSKCKWNLESLEPGK